ncbi:hypothetical protein [Halopiger thermotolerans]
MSESVYAETYRRPDDGDVIELPADARTQVERVGSQTVPDCIIEVIGTGERSAFVLLRDDADGEVSMPQGSKVIGTDPWEAELWYAVPKSAYADGGKE